MDTLQQTNKEKGFYKETFLFTKKTVFIKKRQITQKINKKKSWKNLIFHKNHKIFQKV